MAGNFRADSGIKLFLEDTGNIGWAPSGGAPVTRIVDVLPSTQTGASVGTVAGLTGTFGEGVFAHFGPADASKFDVLSWAAAAGGAWVLLGSGADFMHYGLCHNAIQDPVTGLFSNTYDSTSSSYLEIWSDSGQHLVFQAPATGTPGAAPTFVAMQGTAVLSDGTKVVTNSMVTATSRILLTTNVPGGTPGWLQVSARTPGTSFTILSSSGTDTSTVAYQIS